MNSLSYLIVPVMYVDIALFNTCISFLAIRLCFAAARDKHVPSVLSYIQMKSYTPMPSIMFTVRSL